MIDLRSDTVTKPDREMRLAMAAAEVGDNVIDVDPTMALLEHRVASMLGVEAALWTPSGTMANLIALMIHLRRGDRFLAPRDGHVLADEMGTAAWLAGGMSEPLDHEGGLGCPSPVSIRRFCPAGEPQYNELQTTLLCLENTHNAAGGAVTAPAQHDELVAAAKSCGLRVHLDGARLWHAAVALGVSPGRLATGVDSVQVCLSKGLGAPVGSVLAGSGEFIARARRNRQMLGGGVRQGGVVAAAGLVALNRIGDLADDHGKARRFASGLAELGWTVNQPRTNIVLAEAQDVPRTVTKLGEAGVLASEIAGRVRFVLHRDVTWPLVREALDRIASGLIASKIVDGTDPSGADEDQGQVR